MHGPDGVDHPNEIIFIEVVPPERIVFQHNGPNFRATATFEDMEKMTRLTYSTRFETPSEIDQVKAYAVPGGEQTFDGLEVHLANMFG